MDVSCEVTYRLPACACREQLEGMQIAPPREVHDSGLDLWIIADGQIRLGNGS